MGAETAAGAGLFRNHRPQFVENNGLALEWADIVAGPAERQPVQDAQGNLLTTAVPIRVASCETLPRVPVGQTSTHFIQR